VGFKVGERVWPSPTAPRGVYNGRDGGAVVGIAHSLDPMPYVVRWGNGGSCNYAQHELTRIEPAEKPAEAEPLAEYVTRAELCDGLARCDTFADLLNHLTREGR
jgi:hypothetical protein